MKTTKPDKDFGCIESKRQAQARIYERIKNLSPGDEIDYFRKAAEEGPLGDAWKAARDQALHGRSAATGGAQDS